MTQEIESNNIEVQLKLFFFLTNGVINMSMTNGNNDIVISHGQCPLINNYTCSEVVQALASISHVLGQIFKVKTKISTSKSIIFSMTYCMELCNRGVYCASHF